MRGALARLVAQLRLDDALALLALLFFFLVGLLVPTAAPTHHLTNFAVLLGYYVLLPGLAVAARRLGSPQAVRGVLGILLVGVFTFTVVLPQGEPGLAEVKSFAVLGFPLAMVLALPGGEAGPRGLAMARDWGPYFVAVALYLSLHDVIHLVSPVDRDGWLIAADEALFGGHASVWMERLLHPALTEWMALCYSLYLFFPLTLGLILQLKGERAAFFSLLCACVLTSYLGYVGYLLVPAVGPLHTLGHLYSAPLSGGPLFEANNTLNALKIPRDCFPSLHTAHTLVVLLSAFAYRRWVGLVYLPLCLSCIAATLYLRYHYLIDVVAGAGLACFTFWVSPRLLVGWERARLRWMERLSHPPG